MRQEKFEKDRNRFSHSERLIVEMFLLSYIFVFFLGETLSVVPYLWFLISILGGIIAYFVFRNRDYSLLYGIGLALIVTVPLLPFGVPLMNMVILFLFVLWRVQGNFNGSRINGWPFVIVNTLVFLSFTLIARLVFPFHEPELLVQKQLSLYLLASFLYYFIRMATIMNNSKQLGNFKVRDASKVFSFIIGCGLIAFLFVLTMLKAVRLGILLALVYLFSGLFTLFGKSVGPLLEYLQQGVERFVEEEMTPLNGEMEPIQLASFHNATNSGFESVALFFAFTILTIIAVILFKKKRKKRYIEKYSPYMFSTKLNGNKKHKVIQVPYDYSKARNEVRKSFEQFENEARSFNLARLHGETIKDWFSRMGWNQDGIVLTVYNEVRYGLQTPSENEQCSFIQELEEIKESFFVKKV